MNLLVGENNIGKSTLFTSIEKLIRVIWGNEALASVFDEEDFRYNETKNRILIDCTFSLELDEIVSLIRVLEPKLNDHNSWVIFRKRVGDRLNYLRVIIEVLGNKTGQSSINLGPLLIYDNLIRWEKDVGGQTGELKELLNNLASDEYEGDFEKAVKKYPVWHADNIKSTILSFTKPHLSHFAEFRARPCKSSRSSEINSLEGSKTANVLLNLKNHTERKFRDRYVAIRYAFSSFFPGMRVEAVETSPGSGEADIQFMESGGKHSVPISNVGAGVAELLTLMTNLVAMRRQIFVIEEPETHLHPHSKRSLEQMIAHSSKRNQVFSITHDPIFVNPDHISNLNRIYFKRKKLGNIVGHLPKELSERDRGKITTAMKDIIKREMLFARAILLVEDESQQRFIVECANKLKYNINNAGLSVVEVGGENGYDPYILLAEQLAIPFLCLRDKPWEDEKPEKVYLSLGCELEEYLEKEGLGHLLKDGKKKVGTSKQRVAKYCGENVEVEKIPEFFVSLIDKAIKLCR